MSPGYGLRGMDWGCGPDGRCFLLLALGCLAFVGAWVGWPRALRRDACCRSCPPATACGERLGLRPDGRCFLFLAGFGLLGLRWCLGGLAAGAAARCLLPLMSPGYGRRGMDRGCGLTAAVFLFCDGFGLVGLRWCLGGLAAGVAARCLLPLMSPGYGLRPSPPPLLPVNRHRAATLQVQWPAKERQEQAAKAKIARSEKREAGSGKREARCQRKGVGRFGCRSGFSRDRGVWHRA